MGVRDYYILFLIVFLSFVENGSEATSISFRPLLGFLHIGILLQVKSLKQ